MTVRFPRSLTEDLERGVESAAGQRAVIDARTGRVWTYDSFWAIVARHRETLVENGARPGDRILSLLPNSVEQLSAFLAVVSAGIDFCPLSPLATPDETDRFVALCHPRLAFASEAVPEATLGALTDAGVRRILDISADEVSQRAPHASAAARAGKLLLFTSGTTAEPKALVIDVDTLWSSAKAWVGLHPSLGQDSRFYGILPMSYLGGLFNLGLIPLACGGSIVASDAFSGASAFRFWREIQEQGVNVLWLSPTMLRSLLLMHRADRPPMTADIRCAFLGMANSKLEEKERFEATFGIPVLEDYALSETTFLTTEHLGRTSSRRPGSVGSVVPWVDLRIAATSDEQAPGEIEVRTPFIFDGYLRASGHVDRPQGRDGWFPTGDLGVLDGDELVLRGRAREIVKKGGYLVVLRELEEVAESQADVIEAVALPIEHDFYGESAVLCVRLRPDRMGAPREALAEIRAALAKRLAKFKWPSELVAVSAFPMTESGKIQKRSLRTWFDGGNDIVERLTIP